MKKILAAAMALVLAMSMTACSQGASNSSSSAASGSGSAAGSDASDGGYQFTGTGTNTDSQVRFIQPYLEKHLGVNTVVVNAGGASGTIGTTDFLGQNADGTNILFSLPTPTVYKPAGGDTEYTVDDQNTEAQVSDTPYNIDESTHYKDYTDDA